MNNNIQPLVDKMLASTYTSTDAMRRLRAIKQFILNQLFASAIQSFGSGDEADSAWLPSLGTDFYAAFNQNNVYATMEDLERAIRGIKPLLIYLPFEIPQGEMVRVGMKLRTEYGKNFLVDFKVDPTLIAGCALVWKSIYRDYSVRGKIHQHKSEIIEIVRSYLKGT